MFEVKKIGVLLEPTDRAFEGKAVLNPGVYQDGDTVHLFYRAIDHEGVSNIGYARLEGPTKVVERWDHPIIQPDFDYESKGVEDPRIVKIGSTFYVTYVAHDGKNALTAYATSKNLRKFEKRGIISPQIKYHEAAEIFRESHLKDSYFLFASFYEEEAGQDVCVWHKDFILFPEKIGGKFVMLQRILPDIQIVSFRDFSELTTEFWRNYLKNLAENVVLENKHWFETRHIGGGAPPIATQDGWLAVIHGVEETNQGRVYRAGAMFLDRANPLRLIGKLHEPLFGPTEPWEVGSVKNFEGEVANVVFPTGTALFGDTLYIYYGAADHRIAVASVGMKGLLETLRNPAFGHNGTNHS